PRRDRRGRRLDRPRPARRDRRGPGERVVGARARLLRARRRRTHSHRRERGAGYINPEYFAGGSITLQPRAAARAIDEKVARPLGLALEDAAWGIHVIVNTNMELATRVVSIERGRDPRDLTFVAFGGSGPVHGCRLARALGIPRVILPAAAGVTAALGLLAAEVRFDVARSYVRRLDAVDPAQLGRMYAEMTQQAMEVVRESAVGGEIAVAHSADARYVGQGYELTVPV